jgi:hypothetical protein
MAQAPPADARARKTERQTTDEERFALLISVMAPTRQPGARSPHPGRACRAWAARAHAGLDTHA